MQNLMTVENLSHLTHQLLQDVARPQTSEYVDVEYVYLQFSAEIQTYLVKIVKSLHLHRSTPLSANSVPLFWDMLNGSGLLHHRSWLCFLSELFFLLAIWDKQISKNQENGHKPVVTTT